MPDAGKAKSRTAKVVASTSGKLAAAKATAKTASKATAKTASKTAAKKTAKATAKSPAKTPAKTPAKASTGKLATPEPAERKVMVLTGASGKLGNALCKAFAPEFDIVAVWSRTPPKVASNRQLFLDPLNPRSPLPVNSHPVYQVKADLTQAADLDRIVEVTMARHGRVDVLVNAAGVPGRGLLLANGLGNIERVLRINALAPIDLAVRFGDACWRHQNVANVESNRCIVNVSAAASVSIDAGARTASFAASKAALNMLNAHLAHEFAPFSLRVNAVAPVDFPSEIGIDRVVGAVRTLIEGEDSGRILFCWSEADELV